MKFKGYIQIYASTLLVMDVNVSDASFWPKLFRQGLPSQFCELNLPKHDSIITLIDETGDEHPTRYLPRKTGLSGGWKGFSIAHELVDGDALVFHLISATKFKVILWVSQCNIPYFSTLMIFLK